MIMTDTKEIIGTETIFRFLEQEADRRFEE